MFRTPWHATNHCNATFYEFLEREWSPGKLAGAEIRQCGSIEDCLAS